MRVSRQRGRLGYGLSEICHRLLVGHLLEALVELSQPAERGCHPRTDHLVSLRLEVVYRTRRSYGNGDDDALGTPQQITEFGSVAFPSADAVANFANLRLTDETGSNLSFPPLA
ncbi:hypothetical protein [Halomicrococcus sp. SG-WS-1]|uniref:hypothetical protein n=1 Tax=Halomicrococcus sp. SG-WS-1 TaxID=3439057 RepID=UPI003F78D75B